ncbi:MAG: response regulator [Melioribacteraceae bacterium]|nr:response regulator [Melioribacteraceae bacterium]
MPKIILVVEDQKHVREDVVEILESGEYEVYSADCGEHAMELAKSTIPDLVISDIMMPGMDGYGLLDSFQSDPQLQNIPFIFLSAKSSQNDLRNGMSKGADDYITKPFRAKDLLQSVETRLNKTRNWKKNFDKMRDSFALAVPHELRTPLIPLLGYSDIILEDIKKISKEEIYELVERIKVGAIRLHNRVEKFILLSSLQFEFSNKDEVRHIKSEVVDYPKELIVSTVRSIANAFTRYDDFEINIEAETVSLKAPEFYLTIIIKEIIENACKFSEPGKRIIVNGKREGKFFELSFQNEGKGLTEDQIKNINLFEQFENFNQPKSGSGIGLFIIKKILEILEGTIFIESSFNKFTKVTIKIPIATNNKKEKES